MSIDLETSPKWMQDFPAESSTDESVTRRDFIRLLTVVSGGLTVGSGAVLVKSVMHKSAPVEALRIIRMDELQPGSWMSFNFPDIHSPAVLIRRENGEFIAYSQKCPHLGCPVSYHRSTAERAEHLGCHCHKGRFDIDSGQGVAGPPRGMRPLATITLKIEGGEVWATALS